MSSSKPQMWTSIFLDLDLRELSRHAMKFGFQQWWMIKWKLGKITDLGVNRQLLLSMDFPTNRTFSFEYFPSIRTVLSIVPLFKKKTTKKRGNEITNKMSVLYCGGWPLQAYWGVFKEKEMSAGLKIVNVCVRTQIIF